MSGNKKILMLFAVLLLLVPIVGVVSAENAEYPKLTGYVTDNANIIDSEYEQKITDLADRINKNTTVEIAVLTIESLGKDSIDNYAVQTFRQNGVGKKDNNNGLLILVSKNDRKYRFEVGYGLESTVTDSMKVPIGDKIITPNFKQGQYGKGIYESMIVIEGLVTNNTEVLSKYGMIETSSGGGGGGGGGPGGGTFIIMLFAGIIIVFMIFFFMMRDSGSGRIERTPSIPTTYKPPPYTYTGRSSSSSSSSSSITRRRSSYSSSYGGSHSHSSSFGGGSHFSGFGGGRSGGGGFGGGW